MNQAFIGLGSNLGDSRQHVLDAIDALARLPATKVLARSRFYRTPPWGMLEQPSFVNAAVLIETPLEPHDLLDALLTIENAAGRVRGGERWGPRTLDLDLLYMSGVEMGDEQLTLPHPRMAERAFVLLPLNDIAPELFLPRLGTVGEMLAAVDSSECTLLP